MMTILAQQQGLRLHEAGFNALLRWKGGQPLQPRAVGASPVSAKDVSYTCIVNKIRYLSEKDTQTHGGFVCAAFSIFERVGQRKRSLVRHDWIKSVLDL